LPSFPLALASEAACDLRDLGVEVRTGMPVDQIDDAQLTIGDNVISAHTIVWAAGVQASPAAQWLGAEHDSNGRIFVEADLRVPGHDNIFAFGDTANASSADGSPLPGVAPVAKQQGKYAADQILGRTKRPFRYRDYGNLATVGRKRAVIDWGGWFSTGFTAWLIWSVAHIFFLVGFRSRLTVGVQWLWNYLTYQRSARLITGEISCDLPPAAERKAA